jgi:hypothetical protein
MGADVAGLQELIPSLLLSFWTLSIVRISTNRKHNVSETGPEDGNRSSFRNVVFSVCRNPDGGQSPEA